MAACQLQKRPQITDSHSKHQSSLSKRHSQHLRHWRYGIQIGTYPRQRHDLRGSSGKAFLSSKSRFTLRAHSRVNDKKFERVAHWDGGQICSSARKLCRQLQHYAWENVCQPIRISSKGTSLLSLPTAG
jgi:hypothetical protein